MDFTWLLFSFLYLYLSLFSSFTPLSSFSSSELENLKIIGCFTQICRHIQCSFMIKPCYRKGNPQVENHQPYRRPLNLWGILGGITTITSSCQTGERLSARAKSLSQDSYDVTQTIRKHQRSRLDRKKKDCL